MFRFATAILALVAFACIAGATDCPQAIRVQQVVEYAPVVQEFRVQRVVQQVEVQRVQRVQAVQFQRQINVQRNVFARPQVQRSFSFQRTVIR